MWERSLVPPGRTAKAEIETSKCGARYHNDPLDHKGLAGKYWNKISADYTDYAEEAANQSLPAQSVQSV